MPFKEQQAPSDRGQKCSEKVQQRRQDEKPRVHRLKTADYVSQSRLSKYGNEEQNADDQLYDDEEYFLFAVSRLQFVGFALWDDVHSESL